MKTDAMKVLEKEIRDLTVSIVLAEDETQHNISIEINTINETLLSMCKSRRFRTTYKTCSCQREATQKRIRKNGVFLAR